LALSTATAVVSDSYQYHFIIYKTFFICCQSLIARVSCHTAFQGWLGTDTSHSNVESALICQEMCQNSDGCKFFRYNHFQDICNLVTSSITNVEYNQNHKISGPAFCNQEGCLKDTVQLDNPSKIDEIHHVQSAEICQWLCVQEPLCGAFTFFRGFHSTHPNACQLLPAKDTISIDRLESEGVISGPKIC